jgi:parallel beta-helix repeat protein
LVSGSSASFVFFKKSFLANINTLNKESSGLSLVQENKSLFHIRETKDPKLLRDLLLLVSKLFGTENKKFKLKHRVVIDMVEKIRNEPLSLVYKRHLKTLGSPEVVQRPFFVLNSVGENAITEEQILGEGFKNVIRQGPIGSGIYFPSSLAVFESNTVFRVIICDIGVGNMTEFEGDSLHSSIFDSMKAEPPVSNKSNAAMKEDLAIKSHLQVMPKFVVSFRVHLTDSAHNVLVVSGDGSADHRSLQEALEAAQNGDTIVLRPGNYIETATIDKEVHILCGKRGSVNIESSLAMASNCSLTNVNLRVNPDIGGEIGIVVDSGSPTFEGCDIMGMVHTKAQSQLVIRNCRIHESDYHGIHVADKSTCLIENCEIVDASLCGIQVEAGARGVVMNSTISNCKQNGIYLVDGAKGVIEGCNIFENEFPGIAVSGSDPHISRNRIHHNERSGLVIAGKSEGNTLVEDNNIFANGKDGVMIAKEAVCLLQVSLAGEAKSIFFVLTLFFFYYY